MVTASNREHAFRGSFLRIRPKNGQNLASVATTHTHQEAFRVEKVPVLGLNCKTSENHGTHNRRYENRDPTNRGFHIARVVNKIRAVQFSSVDFICALFVF